MNERNNITYKDYGYMTNADIREQFRNIFGRQLTLNIYYVEERYDAPITLEVIENNYDEVDNQVKCTRKPEDVFRALLVLVRRYIR